MRGFILISAFFVMGCKPVPIQPKAATVDQLNTMGMAITNHIRDEFMREESAFMADLDLMQRTRKP